MTKRFGIWHAVPKVMKPSPNSSMATTQMLCTSSTSIQSPNSKNSTSNFSFKEAIIPGLNLLIDQYTKKPTGTSITIQKSSNNHIAAIPYQMSTYAPLVDYVQHLVLPEWQAEISFIFEQERALVKRRQELMASYKDALRESLPPLIEQFKDENPELFI